MHMLFIEGSPRYTDFPQRKSRHAGRWFILGGSIHESGHLEKSPAGCAVSEEVFQAEQIRQTKKSRIPVLQAVSETFFCCSIYKGFDFNFNPF